MIDKTHMEKAAPIVQEVYAEYLRNFGEPSFSVRFDGNDSQSKVPNPIDIFVWLPTPDVDVTTFSTIGMCVDKMPESEIRAELQFGVRGQLEEADLNEAVKFMANVAATPFALNTYFDYFHTIPCPTIPAFPSCTGILFHPSLGDPGWNEIRTSVDLVKLLQIFPITEAEYQMRQSEGMDALINHFVTNDIDVFSRR
ncbi:MAG: suppressor of fused domain protein [Burkholderiales bacterium]|nr:suppressor of fused domain protein [Burkholderiales bacterium]